MLTSFSLSRFLQLILSKYATETEEGIDKNTYFFWYSIYLYTLIRDIPQDMIQTQWEKHDAAPLRCSFHGLHCSSLCRGSLQGSVSLAIDVIFNLI